jgi:hypothetical protein
MTEAPETPSRAFRLDRARDAFEAAWREGSPHPIEDALSGWEEPERSVLLRELIHLDVRHRLARGDGCRPEDYAARFPLLDAGWLAGAIAAAAGTDPDPRVPGYGILGVQGTGGMGVVYRARETALDRDVAVKVLKGRFAPGSDAARRFLAEARVTAQLQHPAIPPVHQVGTLPDGRPFLVMKLIKGRTLDELLKERPAPAADLAQRLAEFEQICQAVGYAHARGVIHRDLKPGNVMVGTFGEVQVMDWGLAKLLTGGPQPPAGRPEVAETVGGTVIQPLQESDGSETQAGAMLGTPAFVPPEQAGGELGKIDERADVFGLGAILAVILTGEPPYAGASAEAVRLMAVRGQLDGCRSRLEACGAERGLVELCKRCLAFEPADRPRHAGEVAAAVAGLRAAAEARARAAELAAAEAAAEGRKRRWQAATAGAAALVLLAVVAGLGAFLSAKRRAIDDLEKERDRTLIALDDLEKERDRTLIALTAKGADQLGSELKQLEEVGRSLANLAQTPGLSEPQAEGWMRRKLEQDERIFGLTLAFEPPHALHPDAATVAGSVAALASPLGFVPCLAGLSEALPGRESCLYVSRKGGGINKQHLHLKGYRYRDQREAWYAETVKGGPSRWSPAPSEDEGGADTPIVAHLVPIRRGGKAVGVATVDLSLEGFFGKASGLGEGFAQFDPGQRGRRSYAFVISHTKTVWDSSTARKHWGGGAGTGAIVHHQKGAFFPGRIQDLRGVDDGFRKLTRRILEEKDGKGEALDPWTGGRRSTFLFARVPSIEWTLVVVVEGADGT